MATTTINGTNGRFVTGAGQFAFANDGSANETLNVTEDGFLISTGTGAGAVRLGSIGKWKVDVDGTILSAEAAGILLEQGGAGNATATFNFRDDASVSGVTGLDIRSDAILTNAGKISGTIIGDIREQAVIAETRITEFRGGSFF